MWIKSGRDINKFKVSGLTPKKGKLVSSYLIEKCPVNLECKVAHKLDLKGHLCKPNRACYYYTNLHFSPNPSLFAQNALVLPFT